MRLTTIFDTTNPLIVVIEPDANGVWQIQPSANDKVNGGPFNGQKHRDIVSGRAGDIKPKVKPQWDQRRAAGAPADPTYFAGDHVPIVLISAEQVKFTCNYPFTIWVDRDPHVSIVPGSPQNPFGMTRPVDVSGCVSAAFTVQMTQQIFYKCTAYVDIGGGQTLVIDPDTIIDF